MATPSNKEPETSNPNCVITNLGSNCALLCSAFSQTPFFRPSNTKPNLSHINVLLPNVVRDLQNSIANTFDECFKLIELFASQNPFVNKIVSLSSHFHTNFSQMRCRNARNMNSFSKLNFAAILPGDSVAGMVAANGVLNFLNLFNALLVARLVLTWFPSAPPAIVSPLSTICDPYLNIFRGLIPPLGGTLDLSPILAFLVLNALTSTASALPAELPSSVGASSHEINSSYTSTSYSNLTTPQEKWIKRVNGNKPKSSTGSGIN